MSETLNALNVEFQSLGLESDYKEVGINIVVVRSKSGSYVIGLFMDKDKLHATEYDSRGCVKRDAVRAPLGSVELYDPKLFSDFVDMIVQKIKSDGVWEKSDSSSAMADCETTDTQVG